jgi:hypothetical protein
MRDRLIVGLVAVVAAAAGIAGVAALLASRDDSTVAKRGGPGVARTTAPTQRGLVGENQAIRPGNVVLFYSDERLTQGLRDLAREIGGTPSAALLAAGQVVTVQRRPNQRVGVIALTATRRLEANGPGDAALRAFIEYWLGRKP